MKNETNFRFDMSIIPAGMFLIFLTLKLTGVIAWSWWWITAPLWGIFAVVLILLGIWFGGIYLITYFANRRGNEHLPD